MTVTKLNPNETIGDHLQILTWQINRIIKNCHYQEEIKSEWVQWVTADVNRTSLKSITQAQAKQIIIAQEGLTLINTPSDNWAYFDKNNQQHSYIRSLLIQMAWSVKSEKFGEVADLERLSNWLKSERSPVRKKLTLMSPKETSTIISALEYMVAKHHSK